MRTIRSYKLRLYGNLGKQAETYGIMLEYRAWLWHYLPRFYTKGEDYVESTQGLGWLANQAMKHARQMLKAGRNAGIATGERFSCPQQVPLTCEAVLEPNAESTFDYWVKVTTGPRLPAQTHRALKRALRKGGTLKKTCYIFESKGALYARVFVAHEKPEAVDSGRYLGVDVGVNAGVARSDGYIGKSLRPVLRRAQQKHAEQRRQGPRKQYVEYLASTPKNCTCTYLAEHLEGVSHDVVNDFLREKRFLPGEVWKLVKGRIEDSPERARIWPSTCQRFSARRFLPGEVWKLVIEDSRTIVSMINATPASLA